MKLPVPLILWAGGLLGHFFVKWLRSPSEEEIAEEVVFSYMAGKQDGLRIALRSPVFGGRS